MIIKPHAFKNCSSLKVIEFKNINEPVLFGFLPDDNVPNDISIIVPDNLYNEWKKKCSILWKNLVPYSEKIQNKINSLKNSTILQAYYHIIKSISKIDNEQIKNILNTCAKTLFKMYNISKEDYSYFEYLQEKKEKLKNGKEI